MLVDFFIIGVQKSGTTALVDYLRGHSGLQLSQEKEVHHFDDEERIDWSAPIHDRLHAQFDWGVDHVLRGEATPIYVYWPPSLLRLRSYNPAAKLIVGLRHPSFRAFSHWRIETSRGNDDMPFQRAVSQEGRERVSRAPGGVHHVFSYVERGFYAAQIERLLKLFPRAQLHFFRTDRLWDEPGATLTAIERFLGVENLLGPRVQRRYIVPVAPMGTNTPPAHVRSRLDETFRNDIRRTSELTELDLSDWLHANYREPMHA